MDGWRARFRVLGALDNEVRISESIISMLERLSNCLPQLVKTRHSRAKSQITFSLRGDLSHGVGHAAF
jgi:hypothetical protein